jgi:zinc protease
MNWNINKTSVLRPIFVGAAVASLAVCSFAQDKAVSLSKVERKGNAPVSKDLLQVKIAHPIKATLPNGIRLLIIEDHRTPTVTVHTQIAGAGALHDPADRPGLANLTAVMLKEGAGSLNSRALAEAVDTAGVAINANAPYGSPDVTITANGLSDNFDQWFALVRDEMLAPTFPEQELGKARQRALVQLKQQRSSPGFLANERFAQAVYGKHPASIISATAESLTAITPAELKKYHDEHYVPQNTIIGIAGDVDAKTLVPKLTKLFANWKKTDAKEVLPENPKPASGRRLLLVDRPGSVQTNLVLGNIAIDRRSPDYIRMVVLNRVIGGGAAGRLFLNLREEKGYTYGAYSNLEATKYTGPWRAYAEVRTDVTGGAMKEFLYEIDRIRTQAVPASELEDAKRSIVASFALSLEQPTALLSYAVTSEIYGFPADYWDTYPQKIMAISADDVKQAANKYLDPASLQIVAVGDATKVQPMLTSYGQIETFDTQGKVVPAAAAVPPTKE